MCNYISSKRQRVLHLCTLLFPLAGMAFCARCVIREIRSSELSLPYLCLFVICLFFSGIGFFGYAWKFFDDPILGKFSFDLHGVKFFTPIRTIEYSYADCAEIGFTRWFGANTLSNQQYMYYIYLSKIPLTEEQRSYLFEGRSKTRRGKRNMPLYQSEYVLFQYSPEVFAEFIKCVPEPFRSKLIEEESHLNLTPREKRLNS